MGQASLWIEGFLKNGTEWQSEGRIYAGSKYKAMSLRAAYLGQFVLLSSSMTYLKSSPVASCLSMMLSCIGELRDYTTKLSFRNASNGVISGY